MNQAQSIQPTTDEPSPQELQAWADEAQACIDSGEVIISDHRKARATIIALRSHATLKARIEELEGALKFLFETKWKSDRYNMEFEGRVTCYQLDRARAALQPKAGS